MREDRRMKEMVSFKYIIIADEWLEGSENGTESIKNHMHCQCLTLFHFGVICVVDLDTIPERYIFEVVFFFQSLYTLSSKF